ncbi:MAG: bifunctional phosphoribosylaminoimidazolecarboxamide formyltransferase/IMP cyclohydrolase [Elusimicrobiota bacterium]|nr:bifunctional phosphoribosylaminoimidazolecarboxamide formyltransferase/IMP cyclohydrolase [Elusimicrobiota bacterium]
MKISRALISVADKTGLDFFVKELTKFGIEIISTGGTKKYIESLGINAKDIADFTGFPEILDGRVKTLHPKVHGGILAKRKNKIHQEKILEHNIQYIDMIVVNLYPFIDLLKKEDKNNEKISQENMIENIDIGGPSMLRSAAKNFEDVVVICDPNDYKFIINQMNIEKDIPKEIRMLLSAKVFAKTSNYDYYINLYLEKQIEKIKNTAQNNNYLLYKNISKNLKKVFDLRYGENPHQKAAYYIEETAKDVAWQQFNGKELSYNNLLDLEASWNIVNDISTVAVAIVKHNNPCGVGTANTLTEAYKKALATDIESAYGGIVAVNRKLDKTTAIEIDKIFTECIIAPSYEADAIEILKRKKNLRIIELNKNFYDKKENSFNDNLEYKKVFDGFLIQEKDNSINTAQNKIVTNRAPDDKEIADLDLAWIVCKHVKSNAIVLAKEGAIIGIGAGQMSRLDSVKISISKAKKAGFDIKGSVIASDAFFPFKDSIEVIAKYGVSAIIQPGGSIRDPEVINACNENNMSMIFTYQRHFRH